MKQWNKYLLQRGQGRVIREGIDDSAVAHATAMGGYEASHDDYASKDSFVKQFQQPRFAAYGSFIQKYLRGQTVFSVPSGRAFNEMLLMEGGCEVVCADLAVPPCYEATKKLFGDFKYHAMDILTSVPPEQYDSVLCLGLIYLFDNEQLDTFFRNISEGIKPGGEVDTRFRRVFLYRISLPVFRVGFAI